MTAVIASVVEGHGEVKALPVLLRRIALERYGVHVDVPVPWRLPATQMHGDALARAARVTAARVPSSGGGLLVLRDADDLDPGVLTLELQQQLDELGLACPAVCVVAVREFEAWLLAALPSLRGHRSIRDDAEFPGNPEGPRDAKGAMSDQMLESYKPTIHQVALVALMDIGAAEGGSPSFASFVSTVGQFCSGAATL